MTLSCHLLKTNDSRNRTTLDSAIFHRWGFFGSRSLSLSKRVSMRHTGLSLRRVLPHTRARRSPAPVMAGLVALPATKPPTPQAAEPSAGRKPPPLKRRDPDGRGSQPGTLRRREGRRERAVRSLRDAALPPGAGRRHHGGTSSPLPPPPPAAAPFPLQRCRPVSGGCRCRCPPAAGGGAPSPPRGGRSAL